MQHISINVSKEIKNILPDTLEKDLQDNEEICPVCHGLGVVVDNNIYGIKGDTSEVAKKSMFPYNHQAIKFCPNCYNGVIQLCEYCRKQLPKGRIKCDCWQQKEKDVQKRRIKYQETIDKAKEIAVESLPEDVWLYDKQTDDYFSDIDYFVDAYRDNEDFETEEQMLKNLPPVLWVCESVDIAMDAYSILESACEELHEDAMDHISHQDIERLQNFMDEWCKKQSGTKTAYPCYKEYVRVKKEWFE
ncbi:MAG: hypothetical protein HDR13_00755 [Lachnospiraceae bacterium]|nr:hypothetical protein [Lachnospiraceae bacterium]